MVSAAIASVADVWRWLGDVPDPEIPAISVVDLGIVRDVAWSGDALHVTITPTYSGCPATRTIERDIVRALRENGVARVELDVKLAPAWTTDWLTREVKEKLRAYGIAPPEESAGDAPATILRVAETKTACPRCGARDVTLTSAFGSTPCKALYRCNACREPVDQFKCH
ncbi:MAG: phenylacetate-CoA oxygenase subunit PaaJ [Candidatus Eremiobacteraeota bacterium]|nr:phenylacetate-CoA oxygenase subunit PaaJ [Candidatus Eremiobacteraeota bacterium]